MVEKDQKRLLRRGMRVIVKTIHVVLALRITNRATDLRALSPLERKKIPTT
eukprot:CAMPEP_0201251012 /NCGR_PEP_ID=MMETSP0852-20130820/65651_1 /ASSEMBLY_ACC=CAM_ASM_000632 /TAXON_ID=183588 /ORGANISM="Pseudo-nitzschia fraudulenta, Strain WWA7" /LENGTH=50 /DNA_ID=CAMNT_0047550529 /DNA_START=274 /DNA_END=423 /DNA_ORIENTATION=+